jgi:hypothetical protein
MRYWLVLVLSVSLLTVVAGCAESSTSTSGLQTRGRNQKEGTDSSSAPQSAQAESAEGGESEAPEPSMSSGQSNALSGAEDYLSYESFSKKGLIEQLEYEGYKGQDAAWAANHVDVDWNEQAFKSAKNYLSYESFSETGLVEQLEYEGFTAPQAKYGAEKAYG